MRLKRWESPRKQGRNNKGKGGSARKRQLKKQQQMLRKKLKGNDNLDNQSQNNRTRRQGEETLIFPLFFASMLNSYSTRQLGCGHCWSREQGAGSRGETRYMNLRA